MFVSGGAGVPKSKPSKAKRAAKAPAKTRAKSAPTKPRARRAPTRQRQADKAADADASDAPAVAIAAAPTAGELAEQYDRKVARSAAASRAASLAGREIPPIDTRTINWERRLACERELMRFGYEYLDNVLKRAPGRDHERCVEKMERATFEGGKFAFTMPRGGGKTTWCRVGTAWGVSYGHRRYAYLLGANEELARKSLKANRMISLRNARLMEDFPELYAPIRALGQDSAHKARGQLYRGRSTWLEWGPESVTFPAIVLSAEEAKPYLDHAPHVLVPFEDGYVSRACGARMETGGIWSGVRGPNEMHPIFGDLMRPDLIFIDDVQNDQGALSLTTCQKLTTIIEGAVKGLAGPGELPAILMPCTVIQEGDVSDTFTDPEQKAEWQGEKCGMVNRWPDGINDYEFDEESAAAAHWLRYRELRIESFREFGDIRLATAYYREHRAAMDRGFEVSWESRYNNEPKHGHNRELSAQQHAMNLRFESPETFPAEYQNRPKKKLAIEIVVKAADLVERVAGTAEGELPAEASIVCSHVDPQDEILFWKTLAVAPDFSGVFVAYGTWPALPTPYFTKEQTQTWCLLSRALFEAYPQAKPQLTDGGKTKAPFEAKVYHAVKSCLQMLSQKQYPRAGTSSAAQNTLIGVDTRWGKASNAIKRAIGDMRRGDVMPVMGQYVSPTHKQFEEYSRTPGWIFEDQVHAGLQECMWIWRPGPDGRYYLSVDSNRAKTFLMNRLACPPGSNGAIRVFHGPPERHRRWAEHIADSEYPLDVYVRGRKKQEWKERDGRPDNDLLDCGAMLVALCSRAGARLQENLDPNASRGAAPRRSLKDRWRSKHGG